LQIGSGISEVPAAPVTPSIESGLLSGRPGLAATLPPLLIWMLTTVGFTRSTISTRTRAGALGSLRLNALTRNSENSVPATAPAASATKKSYATDRVGHAIMGSREMHAMDLVAKWNLHMSV
jgi:hypothetical protein